MKRSAPVLVLIALVAAALAVAAAPAAPAVATVLGQAPPVPGNPGTQREQRDRQLEQQTRDIAKLLKCPVCQNLSVADSPSQLAEQMLALIREQLEAGRSREAILAYFAGRYGEDVLLDPPKRGFSRFLWWGTAAIPLGGLAVVALLLRRWLTRSARGPADARLALVLAVPEDERRDYEALLERELGDQPPPLEPVRRAVPGSVPAGAVVSAASPVERAC